MTEPLPVRRVPDAWPVEPRAVELSPLEREIEQAHAGPLAHRTNITPLGVTTRADQAQPQRVYQDPAHRRLRAEIVANLRLSGSIAVTIVGVTLFVGVMFIAIAVAARAYDIAQWIAP